MYCENRAHCPHLKQQLERSIAPLTWRDHFGLRIATLGIGALISWPLTGRPFVGALFTLVQSDLQKPLNTLAAKILQVSEPANQAIGRELMIINRGLSILTTLAVMNIGLSFFESAPINNDLAIANFFILPTLGILMSLGTAIGFEKEHFEYHQQQKKQS